jgi:hypothetical protein
MLKLTGIGHDAGNGWPPEQGAGTVPVVLVCRATATGTAKAATAVEQWRESRRLRHILLLALVVIAASPKPVPARVSERLLLLSGWVPGLWWIGWRDDYLAADDVRMIGPAPDVVALRQKLIAILERHPGGRPS